MVVLDFVFYYFEIFIFVLVSVAFLTLLERKVLSYSQLRKGPNKLGILGVLQPFSDAVKLFSKEDSHPSFSNFFLFWLSPLLGFLVIMLTWVLLPSFSGFFDIRYGVLFFLCCISVSVYGIIFSGWASNSKYAFLGSMRAIAQTISYEIVLAFIFLYVMFLSKSLEFSSILHQQSYISFILCSMPMFFIFFFSSVVETNRAPFDLAEGESELVSGFNVEYGGLKFALIFMAEYASILFMCFLSSMCFMGNFFMSGTMLLVVLFLILRASFPRIRYDVLMAVTWKSLLPFSLILYLFISYLV